LEVVKNNRKVSLPDAIIVGAAKAGTTSLFNYLTQHPQVFSPRLKEPWFFSYKDNDPAFTIPHSGKLNSKEIIFEEDKYLDLYNDTKQYIIDGSTSYLYTAETTIKNIKDIYGDKFDRLKIVIVLRNPIERAWSHYMMHIRDNRTKMTFKESIKDSVINDRLLNGATIGYDYVGFGMYCHQVKLFMQTFSNVKILLYDDFSDNAIDILNQLTAFFELDNYKFTIRDRYNVSGEPKNKFYNMISSIATQEGLLKKSIKKILPAYIVFRFTQFLKTILYKKVKLMENDKKRLIQIYKEDVINLEKMIDIDIQHWLK
tara:strand:- start:7497 stop:8438 length:942 start_codon:yes stop_codon:yes gene_type:complete